LKRLLDVLRRIYVNAHFFEALNEAPTYLKFLRELFSNKFKPGDVSMAPIGEAYNVLLQSKSLLKL